MAYLAGAWAVLEVSDVVGDKFGWPAGLYRSLIVLLAFGLLIAAVLAWYHGERGYQRVTGRELTAVVALLLVCGATVGLLRSHGNRVSRSGRGVTDAPPTVAPLRAVLYDNPSVAILPLRNLGAGEDEPFVEGLHDDILAALQGTGGLTVISSPSVQRYRDGARALPEIARELRDVFAIRTEIARAVAEAMAAGIELDPIFDGARGDPAFERVMARMRADVRTMGRRVLDMEADLERARVGGGPAGPSTAGSPT